VTIKTLRVTHYFRRVTRKVKSVDCSGNFNCRSICLSNSTKLLGRADYSYRTTEVQVIVVESGIKNARYSTTNCEKQNGECATAQAVIIIALRVRSSGSGTFTGGNRLNAATCSQLSYASLSCD
jgi:hypothetical protein